MEAVAKDNLVGEKRSNGECAVRRLRRLIRSVKNDSEHKLRIEISNMKTVHCIRTRSARNIFLVRVFSWLWSALSSEFFIRSLPEGFDCHLLVGPLTCGLNPTQRTPVPILVMKNEQSKLVSAGFLRLRKAEKVLQSSSQQYSCRRKVTRRS